MVEEPQLCSDSKAENAVPVGKHMRAGAGECGECRLNE